MNELTTENSNSTTKWRAPYIVHYICDRELFRTQLLYAIGCLPTLPCRHCVKPANNTTGGKASLVISSRKNASKLEGNVLLSSRPLCRANSNRRRVVRGYPVYKVTAILCISPLSLLLLFVNVVIFYTFTQGLENKFKK